MKRYLPDTFMTLIIVMVVAASIFPCHGEGARLFNGITKFMICLLFFLHGCKLSPQAVKEGMLHWRLHLTVLACTFAVLPALGLLLKPLLGPLVTPELYLGVLFVCVLPSTVQSSIAFTSIARGNVPAAVCAASASNLLGIFLTPMLVGAIVVADRAGGGASDAAANIAVQLFLPFVAGQLARPWLGPRLARAKKLVKGVDQGSILLVVYTAFSEAVNGGLWQQLPLRSLLGLMVISGVLLALIIAISTYGSRMLGFSKEDEITIVFCGSKKSMASGIPMAKLLFSGHALGAVVLPLMLFHQLQLMVCTVLAQRYAARAPDETIAPCSPARKT